MKAPFSFFFVAALMILTSLSACKKEKSATTTSKAAAPLADTPNKQQNSPIAYVEVDSLLTQYKFCTENKAVLEAKSKQYQSQVAAKMAQVQKAYADFQQKMQSGAFTTREQAEAAQLRIQKMQQEAAKLEEQLQKRMTAEQEKFNNTLRDSLQSFLNERTLQRQEEITPTSLPNTTGIRAQTLECPFFVVIFHFISTSVR